MTPWLIVWSAAGAGGDDWEKLLGHPLRGPVMLNRLTAEEAVRDFCVREGVEMAGFAALDGRTPLPSPAYLAFLEEDHRRYPLPAR